VTTSASTHSTALPPSSAAPAALADSKAALRPHRRALWQLIPAAQTLLLGLSWPPQTLRAEIERVLTRQRRQPVVLRGSEADVLASLLHDLQHRNPLSEHLQRLLAARHRLASQRVAGLRELQALKTAWLERPAHEPAAATLWALLTHPQTPTIPALDAWLTDEMQQWAFAQARRAVADRALHTAAEEHTAALQAEVDVLRQRLLRQQQQAQQALAALQTELAQVRGRLQPAVVTLAPRGCADDPPSRRPWPAPHTGLASGPASQRRQPAAAATTPTMQQPATAGPQAAAKTTAAATAEPAGCPAPSAVAGSARIGGAAAPVAALQGRQILCVGGIQHAVARYRQRIERLGGRFEHHDGGIEDNPRALQGQLARADLVICQAGCINHAAYHRIKQHCQRTGKPCAYLERASLARFERALLSLPALALPAGAAGSGRDKRS
jgi:hypothetical protein